MKRSLLLSLHFLALLALLWQCAGNALAQSRKVNLSPEAWPQGELEKYWRMQKNYGEPSRTAECSQGMVTVTSDAFAARAGLGALQQGGGAADAALAAALAQIALRAGRDISYAGILTMVYYDAASRRLYSLNAAYNTAREERDPLSIPKEGEPGGRTVLVPGFFAGVQAAHKRFGKLPFASLFDPAIYVAEKGFVVDESLDRNLYSQKSVLIRLPEARRIFTKENGEPYRGGELFRQPQLAGTLRKVAAQGANYIYQGEWAKKFVAAVRSEGGKLAIEDMQAYRAVWSEPLHTGYHGYQVYSLGHPSIGGVNTIEAFNLLEVADLQRHGHFTTSPEALYEFIQICRAGLFLYFFSPDVIKAYLPQLDLAPPARAKKENARRLWQTMHEPAWQKLLAVALPRRGGSKHSAGVVAVDAQGNVASIVHTNNATAWGATGIFVDGVSIPDSASFQQNKIARLKPGDRLPDPTNPVIVLKNGKPYLASSSIGAGLHATTINNLVNVLDFGMDLKKSIDTPNFLGPFFDGGEWDKEVLAEGDFAAPVIEAVIAKGQAVKVLTKGKASAQFGYWIAVQIDPATGKRIGVAPAWLNGIVIGY